MTMKKVSVLKPAANHLPSPQVSHEGTDDCMDDLLDDPDDDFLCSQFFKDDLPAPNVPVNQSTRPQTPSFTSARLQNTVKPNYTSSNQQSAFRSNRQPQTPSFNSSRFQPPQTPNSYNSSARLQTPQTSNVNSPQKTATVSNHQNINNRLQSTQKPNHSSTQQSMILPSQPFQPPQSPYFQSTPQHPFAHSILPSQPHSQNFRPPQNPSTFRPQWHHPVDPSTSQNQSGPKENEKSDDARFDRLMGENAMLKEKLETANRQLLEEKRDKQRIREDMETSINEIKENYEKRLESLQTKIDFDKNIVHDLRIKIENLQKELKMVKSQLETSSTSKPAPFASPLIMHRTLNFSPDEGLVDWDDDIVLDEDDIPD